MFAIIDIETTGNSFKHGQITEIAVFQHNGYEITGSYSTLVKPDMDIPLFITRLTGISNEMVKDAPPFYQIAKKLIELTAGRIFVAHNVMFDYKFIKEEYDRLGYDFYRKTLCTVKLSRKLFPGHKSYSLGNLCTDIGIEINGRHRAAGDAYATAQLFSMLIKENDKINYAQAAKHLKLF